MLMFIFKCIKGFDFYRVIASIIHFLLHQKMTSNAMKLSVYISLIYILMHTQAILDFLIKVQPLFAKLYTIYM